MGRSGRREMPRFRPNERSRHPPVDPSPVAPFRLRVGGGGEHTLGMNTLIRRRTAAVLLLLGTAGCGTKAVAASPPATAAMPAVGATSSGSALTGGAPAG